MKEYYELTQELREFIEQQHLFFVATAPPIPNGHVNVSPKGLKGTFQFVSHKSANVASHGLFAQPALAYFAYLDIGGSGVETHAHLQSENKSITVCFTAFQGAPKILRLFGRGVGVEPGEVGWKELLNEFDSDLLDQYLAKGYSPPDTKIRNIVVVEVQRIRDSCGYGVPYYKFEGDRSIYPSRLVKLDNDARLNRRRETNTVSIDGLPGLRWCQEDDSKKEKIPIEVTDKTQAVKNGKEKTSLVPSARNIAWFIAGFGVSVALFQLKK
eukprot:Phypoly_transcript_15362.p1 GENE.Phypoly_transcript_15362~~Phypoly_transcript_15362.p1  ORF type:complete len:269 (-),score=52.32 Phypoly_transcript_15362:99-905(-)